jgi:fibro-slime domain-containing protein
MGFPIRFRTIGVSLFVTLLSTTTLLAQTVIVEELPDSIKIPVTFFDFHSDKSNPEFECDHMSGIHENMADSTLPEDKIPRLGRSPYLNHYFKYWYVPWDSEDGGKGDFSIPSYTSTGSEFNATVVFNGSIPADHDTAFKNIVIEDSLTFRLIDRQRGIYRFEDSTFFPLDDRGFGNEGRSHNYSFTMKLHTEFSYRSGLQFIFRGDDDVWTYVNNRLALDLGGIHNAVQGTIDSDDLRRMGLTLNNKYSLDFYYAERHTNHSRIMIETNMIQPVLQISLSVEPDIVVEAGTVVTLKSDVKADSISKSEYSDKTKWKIISSKHHNINDFQSDSGANVKFNTRFPYDTIRILGSVFIDGAGVISDTITIITTTGPPHHISIEPVPLVVGESDWNLIFYPNPIDTLVFFDNTRSIDAYAVVRDRNDFFVRMASAELTEWRALKDSVISVTGEERRKYHGIFERFSTKSKGEDLAVAEEGDLIPDSVLVIIKDFYPVRLRLVEKGHSVINDYLTKIEIETDSSQEYEVYALISTAVDSDGKCLRDENGKSLCDDPANWIKISVNWDLSSPLDQGISPPEPEYSERWTFNPIKPGEGTLKLKNTKDERTEELVLPVTVILSPVSEVTIDLITPVWERIAGHPLKAVVRIKNRDGLIPGTYCFPDSVNFKNSKAVYQDLLPKGGDKHPDPIITVDGVTDKLNTENKDQYKYNQCFFDGIDTVEFVLYYAPYPDDSLHQISVILNGIKASTDKFRLLADELETLVLTHDIQGKNPITDTIHLSQGGSKVAYSHGYDKYGNYRGPEESIWNTNGELPPTDPQNNKGRFHTIFHSNPVEPIRGDLCASVTDSVKDKTVSACASIFMDGQDASIMKAITRDINGNGYLDRIDVIFSKNIKIPENSVNNFSVTFGVHKLEVMRISALEGDSVYSLYLKEEITKTPQTDWQPFLTISGIEGATDEKKLVDDGAAPVVWTVTKNMPTTSRTDDIVTIVLSEKIEGFNIENKPDMVFWVYFKNSSGDMLKVNLFEGARIIEYDNQKTIKIRMTNGEDIDNSNWVNIRYENKLVWDVYNNLPDSMNQKVQVFVEPVNPQAHVAPNPFQPNPNIGSGKIILRHDNDAFFRSKSGGVVIVVTLPLPLDGSKVYVTLKIYDLAGNLVNYSDKADVMDDLQKQNYDITKLQASQFTLKFLWSGTSKNGMKLAPGVYKAIITVDYTNNSLYKDARIVKMVGVRK